ncbi:ORF231 [White spot syndrome virus]|uniref:ORF231 n=1 Tax=White spot syndrome virus TaxID=342409 RepID=A0A2D3I5R4_9VIRU|nr:ORF231 [White spot syndrome virus]
MGHSSLGGGPLTRPDVKFGGWTAGSGQCQIAPETTVAPETYINLCVFLEQAFLGIAAPRKGRLYLTVFAREFYSFSLSQNFEKFFWVTPV